jgi:hypothetical protein
VNRLDLKKMRGAFMGKFKDLAQWQPRMAASLYFSFTITLIFGMGLVGFDGLRSTFLKGNG